MQHHPQKKHNVMAVLLPREILLQDGQPALCHGQLRSDLIRVVGARADGYRLCRKPPDQLWAEKWETGTPTAEKVSEWAASTEGKWTWYSLQLTRKGRLLLSLGRWGTEMILFHLTRRQADSLAKALTDYPELNRVRIFSLPEDGEEIDEKTSIKEEQYQ